MKTKFYSLLLAAALVVGASTIQAQKQRDDAGKDKKENVDRTRTPQNDKEKEKMKQKEERERQVKAEKEKEKAKAGQERDRANEEREKAEKEREKTNNGNAYGRDKGDLQGREFGQDRAEQARAQAEARKKLDENVNSGRDKARESMQRINDAKVALEKDKAEGKVTDEEYQARKARIDRAEEAAVRLRTSVNKGVEIQRSSTNEKTDRTKTEGSSTTKTDRTKTEGTSTDKTDKTRERKQ